MIDSFLKVPKDLLHRCKELSLTEVVLYSQLYDDYLYYKGESGYGYVPKVKHLADVCHCSERTIQTALSHLEKLGLIQRYNRTGQTSTITVRLYDDSILMTSDEQAERKAEEQAKTEASKQRFTESNEKRLEAPQEPLEPEPIQLQPEPDKTPQNAAQELTEVIVYQSADVYGALGKAGYQSESFTIARKILDELKEKNIATFNEFIFRKEAA